MNQEQIDRQLAYLSRIEKPPAPNLRRAVRAEITRRRDRSPFLRGIQVLFSWNELLLRPGIAAGALALALAIGALPGASGLLRTRSESEAVYARHSLHLEVFSPAGLLPASISNPSR